MNREIFFRGRSFSDGGLVYGDLEYERNKGLLGKVRIHTYKENGSYDRQYLVESDTVGQFTGLSDSHGAKIFEGDIVRWNRDQKLYVVVFRSGMFYASVEECNPHIYGGFPLWCLCEEEQHCTIVGNIYDNLELLSTK